MKNIDKRYCQNYHISLIEDLTNIQQQGLLAFVEKERIRWKCKSCGSILCAHRDHCLNCNKSITELEYKRINWFFFAVIIAFGKMLADTFLMFFSV